MNIPADQGFGRTRAGQVGSGPGFNSYLLRASSSPWIAQGLQIEKTGKRWVGFPSKEWTKQHGTKGYSPLLEFADRSISDKFQAAVLPRAEEALL